MCYLLFELKLIERAIFVNLTENDYVGTKRKQQIDKYIRMILVSRGRNVFGVSTWGHQILEMREREWLLAYRSSAVRKLSAQQV